MDNKIEYITINVGGLLFYILMNKTKTFLLYHGDIPTKDDMSVLCVTNEYKWRCLYLLKHTGELIEFIPPISVGFRDDKWNPTELSKFCEDNNIFISEDTYEAIVGRWEIEVKENY